MAAIIFILILPFQDLLATAVGNKAHHKRGNDEQRAHQKNVGCNLAEQ